MHAVRRSLLDAIGGAGHPRRGHRPDLWTDLESADPVSMAPEPRADVVIDNIDPVEPRILSDAPRIAE